MHRDWKASVLLFTDLFCKLMPALAKFRVFFFTFATRLLNPNGSQASRARELQVYLWLICIVQMNDWPDLVYGGVHVYPHDETLCW